jgi:hypothetical protein
MFSIIRLPCVYKYPTNPRIIHIKAVGRNPHFMLQTCTNSCPTTDANGFPSEGLDARLTTSLREKILVAKCKELKTSWQMLQNLVSLGLKKGCFADDDLDDYNKYLNKVIPNYRVLHPVARNINCK